MVPTLQHHCMTEHEVDELFARARQPTGLLRGLSRGQQTAFIVVSGCLPVAGLFLGLINGAMENNGHPGIRYILPIVITTLLVGIAGMCVGFSSEGKGIEGPWDDYHVLTVTRLEELADVADTNQVAKAAIATWINEGKKLRVRDLRAICDFVEQCDACKRQAAVLNRLGETQ